MRSYGFNISVDGSDLSAFGAGATAPDSGAYESRIADLLEQINQRATGTLILEAIGSHSDRQVTIIPAPAGADAENLGGVASAMNAKIPFSPSPAQEKGLSANRGEGAGEPDEALLHQLVHVLHLIQGGFEREPMRDGFDDREEFYAILITNIYASEDQRLVRRDHHGFHIWDPGGADADRFFLENLGALDALREEGPGLGLPLFMGLSRVHAPFNPIRQYLEEKAVVFGQTPEAWARDQVRCPVPPTPTLQPAPNRILGRRFMFCY